MRWSSLSSVFVCLILSFPKILFSPTWLMSHADRDRFFHFRIQFHLRILNESQKANFICSLVLLCFCWFSVPLLFHFFSYTHTDLPFSFKRSIRNHSGNNNNNFLFLSAFPSATQQKSTINSISLFRENFWFLWFFLIDDGEVLRFSIVKVTMAADEILRTT